MITAARSGAVGRSETSTLAPRTARFFGQQSVARRAKTFPLRWLGRSAGRPRLGARRPERSVGASVAHPESETRILTVGGSVGYIGRRGGCSGAIEFRTAERATPGHGARPAADTRADPTGSATTGASHLSEHTHAPTHMYVFLQKSLEFAHLERFGLCVAGSQRHHVIKLTSHAPRRAASERSGAVVVRSSTGCPRRAVADHTTTHTQLPLRLYAVRYSVAVLRHVSECDDCGPSEART